MQQQTLDQLFDEAKARVKGAPEDLAARSALWQIFAARGEIERARKQLELIPKLDSTWLIEVQACQGLLDAEEKRQAVFAGREAPACLGEPPSWFGALAAALQHLGRGETAAALPLLAQVWNSGEACPGSINGQPFEWVRDGDARIGPCLELVVQGRYLWAPWERVMKLEMKPPTEVRDRLWQPAMVQISEEGPIEVFVPVRYPAPRDDAESMGRRTDWVAIGEELYLGYGQKCLVTDGEPVGYLDVRELTLQTPGAARSLQ
jgi:type VI secretion system protein ImpE